MMEGVDSVYNRSTPVTGYGPPGGVVPWGLRVWNFAAYIQDDVKVTDKLTLNGGLRYEYQSVPYEIRNRLAAVVDHGPLFGHLVINPQPLYNPDRDNFGPRLGFAYQVAKKTVLRGGYAIFTNIIPTVYPDQAASYFPLASSSFINNAPYSLTPLEVTLPVLTSTNGTIMPPSGNTRLIPPNTPINFAPIAAITGNMIVEWPSEEFRNGYTMNGNLTLEQQLPSNIAFMVSGVTTDSNTLYNNRYPNAYVGAETAYTPYSTVTPGLGELELFYNQGTVHYLALQTQIRNVSPAHGMQFQINYTWDQDLTDADSVFSGWSSEDNGVASSAMTINDPTCLKCEYARANNMIAQRLEANFDYKIPDMWGAVPKAISRGWEAAGIYTIQSGSPFTIFSSYGTLQYGYDNANGGGTRPFFIQKAPRNPHHGVPQYFANDVMTNQGVGAYWSIPTTTSPTLGTVQTIPGNLGRNTYTGPSWWNLDFSLIKNTYLTRGMKLQLRAEFFNIFNHSTFNTPNSEITDSAFGLSTVTASTERQIQFGARMSF
jgi:hypothetical protein